MRTEHMALLTHDVLLLPEGRVELKVVEPANLRMVADVCKARCQLAVGMSRGTGSPPCYPLATQCRIIDFNQLEDDALSLVLEGVQRVKILSGAQQSDGGWMIRCLQCPNWQQEPIAGEFAIISQALAQFYEVNPALQELYPQLHLEDACWVSQRWLEVLPMYNRDKIKLLSQPDCHQTMAFVLQLIKSHGH
ncbi:ATP-dependent protease [Shewanella sp. NFH-SH190041]|uniref:LON peptidase substrate-binding domain-containing protein n=1 Tax=Shewanella sp. NFH-SH190041 TaxID=2950245 RepID=UPI0021C45417|nr:LON peptidase substrate-binding domain-containing protein [Shewanella sp. NFH-SH190041]BDM63014.1 ATP-dependent protease [Shewanella sp. NFH-SH190041]